MLQKGWACKPFWQALCHVDRLSEAYVVAKVNAVGYSNCVTLFSCNRALFGNAGTPLRRLQDATQLMMPRTCLTKMTTLMSSHGMLQQTATLPAVVITEAFQKRLEDRLLIEINAGQDMAMLERTDLYAYSCSALSYRSMYFQGIQLYHISPNA